MDVLKEYFSYVFVDNNNNNKDEFLYFIKDGKVIDSCFTHLIEKKKEINNDDYDFFLYNHGINGILNKSIPSCLDYQHTNCKFIQIMIEFYDKYSFEIHLLNSEYNYYIVNNFIDSYFILYFLRTHYTSKVSKYENEFLLNYTLNIIDSNINLLTIDNTDIITFDLYKYYLNKCNCKEVCSVKDKDECEKEEEVSKKDVLLLEAENRKVSELMFSSNSKIDYCLENIVDNDFIMDY